MTLGLLRQNQPGALASHNFIQLTFTRTQLLALGLLFLAFLDKGAFTDIVKVGLATGLADIACGRRTRLTSLTGWTGLGAVGDEVVGLGVSATRDG